MTVLGKKGEEGEQRTHIDRRKQELIARNTRRDCPVLRREVDVLSQNPVPLRRSRTEDDTAVAAHAQRALGVVVLEAALLHQLLRHAVTGAEEDLRSGLAAIGRVCTWCLVRAEMHVEHVVTAL